MTLYVYDAETREVVAEIEGADNQSCERSAAEQWGDTEKYGWTYSPAFGYRDGLLPEKHVGDTTEGQGKSKAPIGKSGEAPGKSVPK